MLTDGQKTVKTLLEICNDKDLWTEDSSRLRTRGGASKGCVSWLVENRIIQRDLENFFTVGLKIMRI